MKNRVSLIGRIGQDLEIINFENGGSVVNISLAVDDSYNNDKGERVERSYWISCVAQNRVGEAIVKHYGGKGDQLAIEGKLRTRSYKVDGVERYVTEVVVSSVEFMACRKKTK